MDDPPEYNFKKDGKMTVRTSDDTIDGTWKLEGNVLTIFVDEDDEGIPIKVEDGLLSYIPEERKRRRIDLVRK